MIILKIGILGIGSYLPERILTNKEMESIVDTTDEWITSRTGIRERRIAADDEATSDLSYKAALKAIEDAGIDKVEIELVIVATTTPDYSMPSTAAIVQDKIGIKKAAAFDMEAACTGFVYALTTGYSFIKAGIYKKVLVIGADVFSRILDWEDRATCILFGDGAGAAVLGEVETGGYLGGDLQADGAGAQELIVPSSGSRKPFREDVLTSRDQYVKMNGREIFKFAVRAFPETTAVSLEKAGLEIEDIDLFIPHQANIRIIESIAKRFKQPMEKFYVNLDKYGNTSAATIPIAIDEARNEGKIKKGDRLLLVGFGGGLTYGSCIIEWSK